MNVTHKISAVYYPKLGEIELTWEEIATGDSVFLTTKISNTKGKEIAQVVSPCVYHTATIKADLLAACKDFLKLWPEMRICNESEGKNGCAGCQNEVCIAAAELKGKFLQAIAKATLKD